MSPAKSRLRFYVKVVASHPWSSIPSPTNQPNTDRNRSARPTDQLPFWADRAQRLQQQGRGDRGATDPRIQPIKFAPERLQGRIGHPPKHPQPVLRSNFSRSL